MTPKKKVSPILFGATLVCFLFPFVTVSCRGQKMASFSGAQLAMGTTVDEPQMFGPSQKKMVDPDGTVAISGTRPSTKDLEELDRLGAKVEGRLSVSVPMGARVVRHNAQSEPSFWGLFGAYNWEIKSPGANPLIVVHLSS